MKVAIIYNEDMTGVINTFGMQNKERYNPKTVKMVAEALETGGHNVEIIDGNMNVMESLQSFMPKVLEGEKMGMVFNMAYGIQGESRYTHIPAMLEMLGIPYVGANPSGHALALDKVIAKIIMQKNGISTPDFWVFSSKTDDMSQVKYPVIVKPKMESVSFGLRVVHNETDLREAVAYIIDEFKQQALVEQFIRGREFAVGLLGNNPIEAFPVLEFDLENDPDAIQSVEDKKERPRQKICPANISDEIAEEMTQLSKEAFRALQLRDFARVDIRMDKDNKIYLLEINSMASLGRTGSYVYAAQVAGYDYKALVNKMLDVSVVRYFSESSLLPEITDEKSKLPLDVRIRSFLRSRQENIEKTLQKMINTNTFVRNVEGVNQLSNLIKKQLSALGFAFQAYPQVEVGNIMFYTNHDQEDYDILLLANLDNPKKISDIEYFNKTDQRIYGTGVWEHKGGIAVMLAALQALRFARIIKRRKIGILLTTDDALQGRISESIISKKATRAKFVIAMHGGSIDGSVVTSRSGAALYNCEMNLMQNQNAVDVSKATRIFTNLIHSWISLTNEEKGVIISPYRMSINSNITYPFAHAEAAMSVRFNETSQFEELDAKIRKLLPKKNKKDLLHFQMEGAQRRPAMVHNAKNEVLWQFVKNIAKRLDIQLRQEHRWSSADICFVGNNENNYSIDGMGPIGSKPSKKSEFILRHSLLERATLLTMLIYELKNFNK